MIVITGGAGFIGSTLANSLKDQELIIIDTFTNNLQKDNLLFNDGNIRLVNLADSKEILDLYKHKIKYFYHFGANSSTDQSIIEETINLNIFWSQYYWDFCSLNAIPFMYASSAATYGDGSYGFSDQTSLKELKEVKLNGLYGWSKMFFDFFAFNQSAKGRCPPKWYGLKFFNVYGENEKHKGSQSSVIHSFLKQISEQKKVYLFKSYKEGVLDGEQERDFVSANYCIEFIKNLSKLDCENGIYNVGTGNSKTFLEFTKDIIDSTGVEVDIEFIEMPESLKQHYQYFTRSENIKSKKIHANISQFDYKKDLDNIINNLHIPDDKGK
tara:strand:+ start:381 stop:1358 length:978 start_codon:yes stop_codon:yes gene_type:complete